MAESDVLDILLLAHISYAASNSFMILQPGLKSQSLRSSLSQPSASKPSAPSSDPRWGPW